MPATRPPRRPVYQKLAGMLEGMIRDRSLRAGDRMPSVRHFSSQQGVSIPTALQAYVTLESRGMIEARPKSGFYVRARQCDTVPQPQSSGQPPKVTTFAHTDPLVSFLADQADPKLIPFGAGVPSAELQPGVKLARTMASIARKMGASGVKYDIVPGCEMLRRELSRRSLEWGCALKAEDFFTTIGATEALSIALRATCEPGDTVVVESPTYFGLARMLRELRLNAVPIPADSTTGIDLDMLENILRKRRVSACVLIPNFHNPVGFLMPDENKQRLVHMLATRGIPIIEDDIYGDLQHHGQRPRCLKAFDPDGSVILCGSFSKTLAPGYRVGYLSAGRWHQRAIALKVVSTMSNALLPTLAIAEFLKNGGYDRYLRTIRQAFHRQVEQMREAIAESFPEGIRLSRPQGNFMLWCELPPKVDSMELFKQARSSGISIAPGPLFSPDGGFRNFIRINCGHPWSPPIERAVAVLGHLVRRMA
jgi:DNA-binding transcriptional MocR family regulator